MDYLQEDESVLHQTRRHRLSAVDGYLGITLLWLVATGAAVAFAALGPASLALSAWTVAVMLTGAAVVVATLLHWRRATSLYTITEERVYFAYGRLRFHLLQTTYDKITDLHVHQSLFGRIWGYGTVRVQTAGTGLNLAGVLSPLDFKRDVERARRAFIAKLAANMSPAARQRLESLEEPETLWTGRPSGGSLVGGLLAAGVAFAVATILLLAFLATGSNSWMGAVAAIAVGIALAINQWIAFRYTGYEVTERGVVVTRGWLSRRRVEATFAKVTDVSVVQTIVGRLLGFGAITINTAGSNEAPVVFAGVADPDTVKELIDGARGRA